MLLVAKILIYKLHVISKLPVHWNEYTDKQ